MTAHNGTEVNLMDVVAAILGHVREHALEAINKSRLGGQAVFESRVQWVLTVPAIWDSYGKHFMRTAAHKAGE